MGVTLLYDLLTSYKHTKNPWQKILLRSYKILRFFPFSLLLAKKQHEKCLARKSVSQNCNFVGRSRLVEKYYDKKEGEIKSRLIARE